MDFEVGGFEWCWVCDVESVGGVKGKKDPEWEC